MIRHNNRRRLVAGDYKNAMLYRGQRPLQPGRGQSSRGLLGKPFFDFFESEKLRVTAVDLSQTVG